MEVWLFTFKKTMWRKEDIFHANLHSFFMAYLEDKAY